MDIRELIKGLEDDKVIKTGVDYLDDISALKRGEMLAFTGTVAAGKSSSAFDIATNLAVLDNKRVLCLVNKQRRFDLPMLFIRNITENYGNEICRGLMKKIVPDFENSAFADITYDQRNFFTAMTVATALEDCGVDFETFDPSDFDSVEEKLSSDDYDVVIIDSPYTLRPDEGEKLAEQAFCTQLCQTDYKSALIVTAPISNRELINEKDLCLDDVRRSDAGRVIADAASHIIGLRTYTMYEEDCSKRIAILK